MLARNICVRFGLLVRLPKKSRGIEINWKYGNSSAIQKFVVGRMNVDRNKKFHYLRMKTWWGCSTAVREENERVSWTDEPLAWALKDRNRNNSNRKKIVTSRLGIRQVTSDWKSGRDNQATELSVADLDRREKERQMNRHPKNEDSIQVSGGFALCIQTDGPNRMPV